MPVITRERDTERSRTTTMTLMIDYDDCNDGDDDDDDDDDDCNVYQCTLSIITVLLSFPFSLHFFLEMPQFRLFLLIINALIIVHSCRHNIIVANRVKSVTLETRVSVATSSQCLLAPHVDDSGALLKRGFLM